MTDQDSNTQGVSFQSLILIGFIIVIGLPFILKIIFSFQNVEQGSINIDFAGIFFNSLVWGSLYLSVAMGLTLIYKIFKFPNFAVGEYFLIGGYTAVFLSNTNFYQNNYDNLGPWLIYHMVFWGFLVSGTVSILVDKLVFSKLRKKNATQQTMMITSLGVALGLRALIGLRFGSDDYIYDTSQRTASSIKIPTLMIKIPLTANPISFQTASNGDPLIFTLSPINLIMILILSFIVIVLFLFLKTSRYGKAMRAVADNTDLAASSGINVEMIYFLTAFLAGGISGVGGALYAARYNIKLATALYLLLPGFAVIVLGTVGSLLGAFVGAYVVGFSRIYSEPILSGLQHPLNRDFINQFNQIMPFVILILILLLYPKGIGSKMEDKFNAFSFKKFFLRLKERFSKPLEVGDDIE